MAIFHGGEVQQVHQGVDFVCLVAGGSNKSTSVFGGWLAEESNKSIKRGGPVGDVGPFQQYEKSFSLLI
jgi:hypothetical protein